MNEKYMTDEETDSEDDVLVKRSLKWRSSKCNQFFKKLDERYLQSREKKGNSKPLKSRKIGPDSDRPAPLDALSWAVREQEYTRLNSEDQGSSEHISSPSVTPNPFVEQAATQPSYSTPINTTRLSSLSSTPENLSEPSLPSMTPVNSIQSASSMSFEEEYSELENWIRSVASVRSRRAL